MEIVKEHICIAGAVHDGIAAHGRNGVFVNALIAVGEGRAAVSIVSNAAYTGSRLCKVGAP